MFDSLRHLAVAARGVEHFAAWTGLSVGALLMIAVVAYVFPSTLRLGIRLGIAVALLYGATLYGNATGRGDVEAQWADARKAAIAADSERDAMTEQSLEAKYGPQLAALQLQDQAHATRAETFQQRAKSYESTIIGLRALVAPDAKPVKAAAGNACELGARADRVSVRR